MYSSNLVTLVGDESPLNGLDGISKFPKISIHNFFNTRVDFALGAVTLHTKSLASRIGLKEVADL